MAKKKASESRLAHSSRSFGPDVSDELVENLTKAKPLLDKLSRVRAEDLKTELPIVLGDQDNLCKLLQTDIEQGIPNNESEVKARKKILGENVLNRKKPMSYCKILWQYTKDPVIILLLSLSFVVLVMQSVQLGLKSRNNGDSITLDDWVELMEPVIIVVVVLLVTNITAHSDYKQFQDQERLMKQISDETGVNVCRGGKISTINSADVVVGDVVVLDYGNILPADGRCISSQSLTIDESALTGESVPLVKSPDTDFVLFSLTNVIEGKGRFIVTAVGSRSQNGKISRLLGMLEPDNEFDFEENDPDTEIPEGTEVSKKKNTQNNEEKSSSASVLQMKQAALASVLTKMTIVIAIIVLIIRLSIYFARDFEKDKADAISKNSSLGLKVASKVLEAIQLAVTIIVVGVPEGILIVSTLTATIAAKRMKKDNCIVQFISACETMGNATIICSDKTGTLTQNRMTVISIFVNQHLYKVSDLKSNMVLSEKYVEKLTKSIAFNTNLTSYLKDHVEADEEPIKKGSKKGLTEKLIGQFNKEGTLKKEKSTDCDQVGNKTDCALLALCKDIDHDIQDTRASLEAQIVKSYPFNSSRKSSASLVQEQSCRTLYVKGASEVILEKCSSILNKEGESRAFDEHEKQDIVGQIIEPLAQKGLRTISIAYKSFEEGSTVDFDDETSLFESEFTLIGIVGIEDPVRPEVPYCIQSVQKSGVRVIMVTGDNIQTATSISKQCHIVSGVDKSELLLTSKEFNKRIRTDNGEFDQNKFDQIIPHLCVLARAQPEDKNTLVRGIINSQGTGKKEVVAVTGDGTNDAPALKAADVGFAMGIQGTDIAKKSADIIIDDDNFTSIVKAMLWGRNMYDANTKFIQFQLSVNFIALIFIIATVQEEKYPLRAIALLWLNLIMDTLASLSLATDWPHIEQLDRKPNTRDQSLISPKMIRKIAGHVIYQATILILIFYLYDKKIFIAGNYNWTPQENDLIRNTFVFNTFIMLTICNEFNSRVVMGERNPFARIWMNKKFIIIWALTFIANSIIVIWVGQFIGLASFGLKLYVADVFWILFVSLAIGATSLIWEQILLTIIPNSCLERFEEPVNKLSKSIVEISQGRRRSSQTRGLIKGSGRLDVHRHMKESGKEMNVAAGQSQKLRRIASIKETVEP